MEEVYPRRRQTLCAPPPAAENEDAPGARSTPRVSCPGPPAAPTSLCQSITNSGMQTYTRWESGPMDLERRKVSPAAVLRGSPSNFFPTTLAPFAARTLPVTVPHCVCGDFECVCV